MTALALALWLCATPPAKPADAPRGVPDVLSSLKSLKKPAAPVTPAAEKTNCKACHETGSWTQVRFNHERTGFPLQGQHQRTTCKACHVKDFTTPLPRTCASCHRDVHAGELGVRCESCHDTTDWRSRFDAEAHRRTNFPLVGAHAAVPCVECHGEARERRFTRSTVDCAACHQPQAARTVGTAVDHVALSFDQRSCRECHTGVTFAGARFPDHDRCFWITSGPHAVACRDCHSSLQVSLPQLGGCQTNTAHCTGCHTNADTDAQHNGVPGYMFTDRKCYECHQFGAELP